MPQHSTCWGVDGAARKLAEADGAWTDIDGLFGAWIATMTDLLLEATPDSVAPNKSNDAWADLRARLAALGTGTLGRRWQAEVLALCTPEMGMSTSRAAETWAEAQRWASKAVLDLAVQIRHDQPLTGNAERLRRSVRLPPEPDS
jgi:hypothetical protein